MLSKGETTSIKATWSELPRDILWLIGRSVGSIADFVRFGGVCHSWQSAAAKENFIGGREFPWLMLSDDPNSPTRRFFSLPDGKTYNVLLPETRTVRPCGSVDGWLVTLDIEEKMSLLNPLSRTRIPLPPLGHHHGDGWPPEHTLKVFIKKVILSCPPSSESSDSAVALALYSSEVKLAFARVTADNEWCAIESDYWPYEDAVHYKGQFYAVSWDGKVVVCNIQGVGSSNAQLVSPNSIDEVMDLLFYSQRYLVESSGRLLQVARTYNPGSGTIYRMTDFKVFELDLGCGEWHRLKSLCGDSLFLGFNQSMSVTASTIPGCRGNCIYFTDDNMMGYESEGIYNEGIHRMGHGMGIFSLEDRSIQPHIQGYSYSSNSPPLWVVPNLC